jgi:hypothetical protein
MVVGARDQLKKHLMCLSLHLSLSLSLSQMVVGARVELNERLLRERQCKQNRLRAAPRSLLQVSIEVYLIYQLWSMSVYLIHLFRLSLSLSLSLSLCLCLLPPCVCVCVCRTMTVWKWEEFMD